MLLEQYLTSSLWILPVEAMAAALSASLFAAI